MYQHIKVPAGGSKITVNADFSINVPDQVKSLRWQEKNPLDGSLCG
jgi:hypothetical protein